MPVEASGSISAAVAEIADKVRDGEVTYHILFLRIGHSYFNEIFITD